MMNEYQLWASTYDSVEMMRKHRVSDNALEIKRVSSPFCTRAKSLRDAAKQFQETDMYNAFLSSHVGKKVYLYYINDESVLVRIDL